MNLLQSIEDQARWRKMAIHDYWLAKNPADERNAYLRQLLHGMPDCFRTPKPRWRLVVGTWLRWLAAVIEQLDV